MSLSLFEVEAHVRGLHRYPLSEVGSDRWSLQHERLEALNIQAHQDAQAGKHDEIVVEQVAAHPDSLATIVHELLVIEAWKEKVFPLLLDHFSPVTAVKAYIVLYHEATLCNLLEVLLYHASTCEVGGDAMLELGDYCVRKVNALNSGAFKKLQEDKVEDSRAALTRTTQESLRQQSLDIGFSVAVCATSLLRFLSDHVSVLPLGVTSRLLHTHDVLLSLVPLVENPPWTRRRNGKLEKFSDQKWVAVAPQDALLMTKLEGQVWLTLYNLLMDKACRKQYQYNTHRKEVLIRLRRFFTPILLDQLPLLRELKRLIEELAILNPPPPTSSSAAIIELVPEMREGILAEAGGKWSEIATQQKRTFFANDDAARQRDIARLAATYNLDKFEDVLPSPSCGACGAQKPGEMKRCSRCKNEWYCGRACQVAHWKKHQKVCDIMAAQKSSAAPSASAAAAATPVKPAAASNSASDANDAAASAAKPAAAAASTAAKPAATPAPTPAPSTHSTPAPAPVTAAAPLAKKPLIEMLDDEDEAAPAPNPLDSMD